MNLSGIGEFSELELVRMREFSELELMQMRSLGGGLDF